MDNNEEKITKDELIEILDESLFYSHTKATAIRAALLVIIGLGFLFFLGIGNQSLIQHGVAMVMLAASYGLGRNDIREFLETNNIDEFLNIVNNSEIQTFKIQGDTVNAGNHGNGG